MKRTALVILLSLVLFSSAFAILDTRSDVARIVTPLILDVSCFYNDARVASRVSIIEIDAGGHIISGTGTSVWVRDGRKTFLLSPGKSYRITAIKQESERMRRSEGPSASRDITNFEHSTAVGLALEIR